MPDWFSRSLTALANGDIEGAVVAYSDDAIHEFPFSEGPTRRLVGRAEIAVHMKQMSNLVRFGSFDDMTVRDTGTELIIEATGHHHSLPDEIPFELHYVWFIAYQNGLITQFRDYMNPLQLSPR